MSAHLSSPSGPSECAARHVHMVTTGCIADTEALGRCCYDRRESGGSERLHPRARFIKRSFSLNGQMSVDRLSDDNDQTLCRLHDEEALSRKQRFHGWYVFKAVAVRSVGWGVAPCPTRANQWHAEVSRPDPEQDDVLTQNCSKIASQASWRDRPPADLEKLLAGV